MAMQKISDYSSQVPFKDFKLVVKSYWFIKPLCATVYICEQEHHHGPVAEDKTFDFVHDIRKPLCINIDMRGKQENYTNEHEDHALDMVMNNMLEDFTDEEIEEMNNLVVNINREKVGIYLQSVTSSPPYWVTDTTVGDVEINYTS